MAKQISRKEKKVNSKIVKSCLSSFLKLSKDELNTLRWNINALLDEDFLNTQFEIREKAKDRKWD